MNWLSRMWTIASIELQQRVRGTAWYVLLGVFVVVVLVVTLFTWISTANTEAPGAVLYSAIVYFVLLLGSLVTPALSGNAVNGDRENGTLATTQVTLVTTTQLVLGKLLAAWITALAFLVAALPFLLFALVLGGAQPVVAIVSVLVLALELGVVAAIGVGLSGLIRRPLFSVVVTYLVVALLSIGTLIAFGLGGWASQKSVTVVNESIDWESNPDIEFDPQTGMPIDAECTVINTYSYGVPQFQNVWWVLAANPYVLLADAVPTTYDAWGTPEDAFGFIKLGSRMAQIEPEVTTFYSECDPASWETSQDPTPREVIESTVPSWAVGLGLHLLLAGGLIVGAIARTHAPTRSLAAGNRIA
ncbi:ABC transporter permease [Salinibacterium sp. ZJ77]|uniref:ABC transporter permease n=1 Tax=Salinibacterium sp. ZJ77 TaxID=2708337 RepID=UPI0014243A68|nr:ABC transporter permease [Salinibacterium sp. ZJ77]